MNAPTDVPTFVDCHLELRLLDPHELCGRCEAAASSHRYHKSIAAPPPRDVYAESLAKWGREARIDKAVEECCELVVALMQHRKDRVTVADVVSEIADVEIMMESLRRVFGSGIVDVAKARKIERLLRKIDDLEPETLNGSALDRDREVLEFRAALLAARDGTDAESGQNELWTALNDVMRALGIEHPLSARTVDALPAILEAIGTLKQEVVLG